MKNLLELYSLRLRNNWRFMVVVATLATGAALACHFLDLLDIGDSERGAYDKGLKVFTKNRGRSEDIVIVAIDQKSIDAIRENPTYALNFGTWPYSRNVWARVFEQLQREGAKAIVFDATMDERHTDQGSDLALAQTVSEKGIPLYLGFSAVVSDRALPRVDATNRPRPTPRDGNPPASEKESDEAVGAEPAPERDEAFPAEETFPGEDTGAPQAETTAGETFPEEAFPEDTFPEEAAAVAAPTEGYPATDPKDGAEALAFPLRITGFEAPKLELTDAEGKPRARHPALPISPLLPAISGFGLVETEVDEDGQMRRTRFAYTDGANNYVTLPVAVAADLFGAKDAEQGPGFLRLGDRRFAVNRDGSAEIDYGGALDDRFRTVPLIYVLDDWALASAGEPTRLEKGLFKDKVVFLGGFAVGLGDVKATPFGPSQPGVVKHAAVLQNFLDGGFIVEGPLWLSILLAFAIALFSISMITVIRSSALEFVYPLALFFGFFLVTGVLLRLGKVHLLSALPTYAGEFASFIGIIANHFFANRERERLKEAFSHYLAPDLVERLVEQRELPKLEGEPREVSVLVTDIEDFASISALYRDEPAKLVRLLNLYLTRVSEVLMAHGACLDKYMGDSVVTLFGAPLPDREHALRACRAAIAVRDSVAALNAELEGLGLVPVRNRIGINSDTMFVGNVGSQLLVDYTAVGEGMNLTHRMERQNGRYGTQIVIGPNTRAMCGEAIVVRELDWVRFPGREERTTVFELVGLAGAPVEEGLRAAHEAYAEALAAFRAARFSEAEAALARSLALCPGDGPSRLLLERCKKQAALPVGAFDAVAQVA